MLVRRNILLSTGIMFCSNVAYHALLSDKTRVDVERNGRVALTDAQVTKIAVMKTVHAIIIVVDILVVVKIVDAFNSSAKLQPLAVATPFVNWASFWAADLVVACCNNSKLPKQAAIDMAKASGSILVGVTIFFSILLHMLP